MHQPVPDKFSLYFDGTVVGQMSYYGVAILDSSGWAIFAKRGSSRCREGSAPQFGRWVGLGTGLAWLSKWQEFRPCRFLKLCGDMAVLRELLCYGSPTDFSAFRTRCLQLLDEVAPNSWAFGKFDDRGVTATNLVSVAYSDHTGREME